MDAAIPVFMLCLAIVTGLWWWCMVVGLHR